MKLNQGTADKRKKEIMRPIRKVLTAAVLATGILIAAPAATEAEERCSIRITKEAMESFSEVPHRRQTVNAIRVHVPAMEKGRQLVLSLPMTYSRELAKKAFAAGEGKTRPLILAVIRENLEAGLKALGKRDKTTFRCAPIPEKLQEPQPATPPAKTEPPQPKKRRRTLEIGSTKAEPLLVTSNGGAGTNDSPFIVRINVPVSDEAKVGKVLYNRDRSPYFVSLGDQSVHFTFRFMGAKSVPVVTSQRQLEHAISGRMASIVSKRLGERKTFTAFDMSSIGSKIVTEAAAGSPEIRAYAPE